MFGASNSSSKNNPYRQNLSRLHFAWAEILAKIFVNLPMVHKLWKKYLIRCKISKIFISIGISIKTVEIALESTKSDLYFFHREVNEYFPQYLRPRKV